jgi:hypothetical protein
MVEEGSKRDGQAARFSAEDWRLATVSHSAIAGVSLAAVIELANNQGLSNWLVAASVLFALALPSAVSLVVMLLYVQARREFRPDEPAVRHQLWSRVSNLLALTDQLACFGGVLLLFWHIHWIAGVAFFITSLVAMATLSALWSEMKGERGIMNGE